MRIHVKYQPTEWRLGEADTDYWYCQHADSESDTVTRMVTDPLTGEYDDYEEPVEVCTSCGAYNNGLEWLDENPIEHKGEIA